MKISGNCFVTRVLSWSGFVAPFLFLSFVSQSASYDIGQTYNYRYVTSLTLNEPDKTLSKELTYQVTAVVTATTVWQNPVNALETLLLLQVKQPKLMVVPKNGIPNELKSHVSHLDKYTDDTIVLHLNDGVILELFTENIQSPFLNFKAGIASLFQFKIENKDGIEEVDTSGKCIVSYKVTGTTIEKIKQKCISLLKHSHNVHSNKVLGADVKSHIFTTYTLTKDHVIASAQSKETHVFLANAVKDNGVFVSSEQSLKLDNQEDGSEKIIKGSNAKEAVDQLKTVTGSAMAASKFHSENVNSGKLCKNFSEFIREKQAHFKAANLAKINTAAVFLDVVRRSRDCNKEVLVKVLKSVKNKAILPQLIDVIAASQTIASFPSVLEILNFDSESNNLPERFLTAISVIPHPKAEFLHQLADLVKQGSKSEKLHETLAMTLGSLTKKYFYSHGMDKVVEEVQLLLIGKLKECQSDPCKFPYLRALRNAALPSTLPAVIDVIKQGGKCLTEALKIIQQFKKPIITHEVKTLLKQIFHQLKAKQESTTRILAAEILLDNEPSVEVIQDIMLSLANHDFVEVNTYVLSKIKELMQNDHDFRNKVHQVVHNSKVGNYDVLAPKGTSIAFSNPLFGESSLNATYGLHMEMVAGGLLKRSNFDVNLNFEDSDLSVFSFGLFADGLGSLAGDESSSSDSEEQVMTAGIELGILDSAIRPYTFFTGQGELMGLVWSGTGSTTTPILQGNFLLHDHQQGMVLQNGFLLDISLLGVLSYDLSGSIEVSLWNRNSHSIVSNRGAVVIQSLVRVNSDFINSQAAVTSAVEGSLEFVTDLEFYEAPFKMCTQMKQTPLTVKRIVNKIERIPSSKHRIRRTRKGTKTFPGSSFALHKKNSLLCSAMLSK